MNIDLKRGGFAALIALTMLLSVVATPVAAAGGIGWGADAKTPNPTIETQVTVEEWNGADFDSALEYYDDGGDATELPASLNDSNDNPVTLSPTAIDFADRNEFPRKSDESENEASALDADEWTTSGATVGSSTTHAGVDALNIAGTASSDSATYSNFSVDDGEKSYLTIAADINSAAGTPTLQLVDGDGDYVEITLYDSTETASNDSVLANSTGDGKVLQHQVGDLTVQGSGDGSFDSTEEIVVEGETDADVSVLDAERTRELTFGEQRVDTDDDDDLETVTITEPRGDYSVTGMETLDEVMSDATVYDVTADAEFQAADLRDDGDVSAEFGSSDDYPQWDQLGELGFRLELPTAFDLSYASPELVDEPSLPSERYKDVSIAEGTDDTEFSEIDSYTSVTSSYDGSEEISLDSTVSAGTSYVVTYDVVLTDNEVSAIQNAANSGGAGVMASSSGGFLAGIWGFVTKPFGMMVSAISGIGIFSLFRGGS